MLSIISHLNCARILAVDWFIALAHNCPLAINSFESFSFTISNSVFSVVLSIFIILFSLVIQKYKYSLVIENSNDYCSEKLFDAIINGSIPIYIGPKNTEIFLPGNLYYSCTGSVDEIRKILNSVGEKDINDMLGSMKDFLQSKNFTENWSSEKVYGKIAQTINKFWNIK